MDKLSKSDINRSAIARATGTNLAHISRIFSGKSQPSMRLAKDIADFLEISLDEFYGLIRS